MAPQERYARSFDDALSLARNIRDQATIYYRKDGKRAAYDVVTEISADFVNTGTMFINGRCLTLRDVPPTIQHDGGPDDLDAVVLVRRYAKTARQIFEHNGIDVSTGWDLKP